MERAGTTPLDEPPKMAKEDDEERDDADDPHGERGTVTIVVLLSVPDPSSLTYDRGLAVGRVELDRSSVAHNEVEGRMRFVTS